MKLDLGCGYRLNPGHVGIDIVPLEKFFPGVVPPHYVDHFIEFDLFHFPWPIEDSSVEDAILRYFVEYIPHRLPSQEGDPLASHLDGFYLFFEELYRVMKPYGKVNIIHQVVGSPNAAVWDPSIHRALAVQTWPNLSRDVRDETLVEDPNIDFHLENATDDGMEAVIILDTVK